MGRLKEWCLDWLDRSETKPSNRKIDDPLTILQRIVAALAGIVAIFSSPAIGALVPDLNPNAALVLRVLVILATLVAVNYVVTAKDEVEPVAGAGASTIRRYRYSGTERLIARGVVVAALLVLSLNLVPAPEEPRACDLTATLTWQAPSGTARPLALSLTAGDLQERYPVEAGRPVALQVPSAHRESFSVALLWSDGSRSDFGEFAGCSATAGRRSMDGRATIDLAVR